eukprot:10608084-Prorocentrum_lima.AAC.1
MDTPDQWDCLTLSRTVEGPTAPPPFENAWSATRRRSSAANRKPAMVDRLAPTTLEVLHVAMA